MISAISSDSYCCAASLALNPPSARRDLQRGMTRTSANPGPGIQLHLIFQAGARRTHQTIRPITKAAMQNINRTTALMPVVSSVATAQDRAAYECALARRAVVSCLKGRIGVPSLRYFAARKHAGMNGRFAESVRDPEWRSRIALLYGAWRSELKSGVCWCGRCSGGQHKPAASVPGRQRSRRLWTCERARQAVPAIDHKHTTAHKKGL